jgi:hypothetical protein
MSRRSDRFFPSSVPWLLALACALAAGTVAAAQAGFEKKVSETTGGFGGMLDEDDDFGASVTTLGDLDFDGNQDLAVGPLQGAVVALIFCSEGLGRERTLSQQHARASRWRGVSSPRGKTIRLRGGLSNAIDLILGF